MSRKESITTPNRATCNTEHVVKKEKGTILLEKMRFQKMRSPHICQIRLVAAKRNPLKNVVEEVSNKNMRGKQDIATESN